MPDDSDKEQPNVSLGLPSGDVFDQSQDATGAPKSEAADAPATAPAAPELAPQPPAETAPKQLPTWEEAASQYTGPKEAALPTWEEAIKLNQKPKSGFSMEDLLDRAVPWIRIGKAAQEAGEAQLLHFNWSDEFKKTMTSIGAFNDYAKGQSDISKGVFEGLLMPAYKMVEGAVNLALVPSAMVPAGIAQAAKESEGGPLDTLAAKAGAPGLAPWRLLEATADLPNAFPLFGAELGLFPHLPEVAAEPREVLNGKTPIDPVVLDKAQAAKAIGTTEEQFNGTEPLTPEQENHVIDAENRIDAAGARVQPPQDIHAVARQIAPDVFNEYDALSTRRDTFSRWMGELRDKTRADAAAPFDEQIAAERAKLDDATPRLAKKYQARIDDLAGQRDAAVADAIRVPNADLQRIQKAYQETDFRMRDLAPQVSDAYRQAQERLGSEAAPVEEAPPEPAPEAATAPSGPVKLVEGNAEESSFPSENPKVYTITDSEGKEVGGIDASISADGKTATVNDMWGPAGPGADYDTQAGALGAKNVRDILRQFKERNPSVEKITGLRTTGARGTAGEAEIHLSPTAEPQPKYVADIVNDETKKLMKVGVPEDVARASAQVDAAYYETRAARFEGKRGTAADLYNAEAPEIRAGETRARAKELAQTRKGKIRIAPDGRKIITLFKDADATTFVHESGHKYLEDLMADAEHPLAAADLKADAQAVRDWLGVKEGAIPTRAHEKFARGFERYLMEGVAPSKGLAHVFAQFRDWLTRIYQSVTALKAPINDDIRGVFDRLLSSKPERTVIAPEREPVSLGDIHEAEADRTPPEEAEAVRQTIREEADQYAKTHVPEIADELGIRERPDVTGNPPEGGIPDRGGAAGQPPPGAESGGEGAGAVGAGGSEASPERAGSRPEEPGPTPNAAGPWAKSTAPAGSAQRLKDLAGNINLANLNVDEDARAIIRQLAAENSDFNDVRFGTPAYQQAMLVKASGAVLEMTAKAAADAFRHWNESGSEEAAEAYSLASQRVLLAANARAELAASAGRALAAFRAVSKRGATEDIVAFVKRSTGKTLFQLKEEGSLLDGLDTTEQRADFLEKSRMTRWQKIRGMILSYFINNLISGPITHTAYSIGNTTWALFKAGFDTTAAATIDAVREYISGQPIKDRVYFREVPAELYGLYRGFRDALPAAGRALKTGTPYMKGADIMALREGEEAPLIGARPQAIPGKVGYVLETPSRSVTAIHTVFYSANYEAEIARRAVRSAIAKDLTGDAFNRHVAQFVQNPPDKDVLEAHDEALKMVLMKKPPYDSTMANLQRAVNNNMAAKIVMPFMQIGSNILREGIVEHTPVGLLSKDVRANLSGKNGAIARSTAYAKIAVGTTAAIATVGLAMEGLITGGGPADPNERRVWLKAGHVPYAIRIGHEWIPYRKFLGPLGPLIAGSADMYEIGHAAGTEGFSKAGAALIFGLSEVVFDETWFSGLSNFIDAARNFDRDGERYIRNLAMDFLPFSIGASQVARMIDPYQREVRTWTQSLKAHTPFISRENEPMNDIFGEPIPSHSMVTPQNVPPDPVAEEMEKVGFFPALPQRTISGQKLDSDQYFNYTRIAGRLARERLNLAITTPGWNAVPPDLRKAEMKRLFEVSRQEARQVVIGMYAGKPNDIAKAAADAADQRARRMAGQP